MGIGISAGRVVWSVVLGTLATLVAWIAWPAEADPVRSDGAAPVPVVAVEAAIAVAPSSPPVPSPTTTTLATIVTTSAPVPTDRAFVHELNDLRMAVGIAPLVGDAHLAGLAQEWAQRMADDGDLRHSELIYGVVGDDEWRAAGENIGYGPTVSRIVAAFAASPSHHANIVNPDYRAVGVGVVTIDDVIWTAHLFAG
ncbi:MAG: CAP domain-containing protein [Actinomycetota bacterium]